MDRSLKYNSRTLINSLFFSWSFLAPAKPLPRYELGIGLVAARTASYPGSSRVYYILAPTPAFIYRGDIFKTKRSGGIKSLLYQLGRFELDLSFDANASSSKYESEARKDMPPLGALLEIGPRLSVKLGSVSSFNSFLVIGFRKATRFLWPLVEGKGHAMSPHIRVDYTPHSKHQLTVVTKLGSKWGSKDLMSYYYEVDSKYATASREAYHAKNGLLSHFLVINMYFNYTNFIKLFMANSFHSYHYAVNRDSPLFSKKSQWRAAAGISYILKTSDEMVKNTVVKN